MELSRQAAGIARIPEDLRDEDFLGGDRLPVLPAPGRPRVAPGQEGCPAGRADGALDVGLRQGRAIPCEGIDRGGSDEPVAEGRDRVVALLVGAEPEDVWTFWSGIHYRARAGFTFSVSANTNRPGLLAQHALAGIEGAQGPRMMRLVLQGNIDASVDGSPGSLSQPPGR